MKLNWKTILPVSLFSFGWWPPQLVWADTVLQNPLATSGGYVDPNELLARVAGGLMMVTGTLTLVLIVIGGYIILTAAGNAEHFARGKKIVIYSLLGLVVTSASYLILNTVIGVVTGGTPGNFSSTLTLFDPLKVTQGPGQFYGQRVLGFLLSGLGALTLLMGIYGGASWLLAAGNEEKITKAKKTLSYAVLGLVIVLASYSIINFVYQPVIKLLQSGQAPAANQYSLPPDQAAMPTACFRLPLGKNFGGVCTVELPRDCRKATAAYQAGTPYGNQPSCANLGACRQLAPGNFVTNRMPAPGTSKTIYNSTTPKYEKIEPDCVKESFRPISTTLQDGSCPFANTSPGDGDKNGGCYAAVEFLPGRDYPDASESNEADEVWACFRNSKATPNQVRTSVCNMETAVNCKKAQTNYLSGQWYQNLTCADVGSCQQDTVGHQCRDGVTKEMCQPKLFPAVAAPTPPWGCNYIGGSYALIDGSCYVPTEHLKFSAGKTCL